MKIISVWPQPGFRRAEFSNFFGNGDLNFDTSDDRVQYKRASLNNSVYLTSKFFFIKSSLILSEISFVILNDAVRWMVHFCVSLGFISDELIVPASVTFADWSMYLPFTNYST